jgi:hypothetical protein
VTTVASTKISDLSNPHAESELDRLRAKKRILQDFITELKTRFAAMQHQGSLGTTVITSSPNSEPTLPLAVNSKLANVYARLNSFEDQLQ